MNVYKNKSGLPTAVDNPEKIGIQESKINTSKDSMTQEFKTQPLLRQKTRRRPTLHNRSVNPVRVELDPAIEEDEDRGARKLANGIGRIFIARAVDMQLFPLNKSFWVGKEHTGGVESAEAEFIGRIIVSHLANRSSAPSKTELRPDEHVITFRHVGDHFFCSLGALGLPEILRTELAFAIVVECPSTRDHA